MKNRTILFFGILLIAIGVFSILGNLLRFDFWTLFWPLVLIGLGVWFLLRPRMSSSGAPNSTLFIGDIKRGGVWQAASEEFTVFVGDIVLDFTQAQLNPGETVITCTGFVSDVKLVIPAGLGVKVTSAAFVSDVKFMGSKQTHLFENLEVASPGYDTAERRVHLVARNFVGDIKVASA